MRKTAEGRLESENETREGERAEDVEAMPGQEAGRKTTGGATKTHC